MNFRQFCIDNNIQTADVSHKHYQPNWVHISCPFCMGHEGKHLGYNEVDDFFCCWRCNYKNHFEVVRMLLNCSFPVAKSILKQYGSARVKQIRKEKAQQHLFNIELPSGTKALTERHKKYLKKRNFDADKLELLWDLKGTGISGPYKFRIIAPIYYKNKLVSYQGRDITNKHALKYKACAKDRESIFHKNIVYGFDNVPGDTVVIVEGITDVWRLGYGAVATFGIKYLPEQIAVLANFKNHIIIFDDDPQAQRQGELLANQLSAFSDNTEIISFDGDPGSLDQRAADELMRNLI